MDRVQESKTVGKKKEVSQKFREQIKLNLLMKRKMKSVNLQ